MGRPIKTRKSVTDKKSNLNTYYQTGVFAKKVNGVIVGYFVGWRYSYRERARNIREGLYFDNPDDAKDVHAMIENRKTHDLIVDEQIA